MLRFCRVIKYRSVWHVLRYVVSGPKASQKLIAERAGSVSAGGKHDIDESAQRSKRSTETERVMQNGGLRVDLSASFFRLTLPR